MPMLLQVCTPIRLQSRAPDSVVDDLDAAGLDDGHEQQALDLGDADLGVATQRTWCGLSTGVSSSSHKGAGRREGDGNCAEATPLSRALRTSSHSARKTSSTRAATFRIR